jgi:hypothetical protein
VVIGPGVPAGLFHVPVIAPVESTNAIFLADEVPEVTVIFFNRVANEMAAPDDVKCFDSTSYCIVIIIPYP